jgi:ABC-type antimicrobial peptide transport system permease subunit
LLAGIGLYGSLDFGVKARRREIGVRAALGASPLRLVRFLSREILLLVSVGALAGVALYAASAKWIRQALYGVTTSDPLALAAALFVITIVMLLATLSAVWRASHVDVAFALRQE